MDNIDIPVKSKFNYLTHKFVLEIKGNAYCMYICEKCNCKVYSMYNSNEIYDYSALYPGIKFTLTCDEYMIKSIIE